MTITGLMLVRNEQHELGLSARVALKWVDNLVILLHCCTDRSAGIAKEVALEHSGRVWVFADDKDQLWPEMQQRQALLELARTHDGPGATHVATIDADEVLTGNMLNVRDGSSLIRGMVASMPPGHILTLPLYNLRGGLHRFHANGMWGTRITTTVFADAPWLAWHVPWQPDGHHQREPIDVRTGKPELRLWQPLEPNHLAGGVMHLWGASERRLIAKHRAYKIRDYLRWPERAAQIEADYSMATDGRPQYGDIPGSWAYLNTRPEWWEPYKDLMQYVDIDADPWQEKWNEAMIAKYGREHFKGLRI